MGLSQVVRRGAAAARRRLRGSGPSRPKHPAEADPQWATRKAQRRVRRLRTQLAQANVENAQLRQELSTTRASVRDPDPRIALPAAVTDTIARVREESLTYLKPEGLATLARLAIGFDLSRTPGLIIEAGAARGGSAIVLAAAKAVERPMKVYDVFGMIPPPSAKDGADIHRRYQTIASGAGITRGLPRIRSGGRSDEGAGRAKERAYWRYVSDRRNPATRGWPSILSGQQKSP